MASVLGNNNMAPAGTIPDKLYFKIGEVSQITELPAHVLRFWETEFKSIRPKRTGSGQRLYRRQDVETVLKIKHLLYDRKFTIRGANKFLRQRQNKSELSIPVDSLLIKEIHSELKQIRDLLA